MAPLPHALSANAAETLNSVPSLVVPQPKTSSGVILRKYRQRYRAVLGAFEFVTTECTGEHSQLLAKCDVFLQ